MLLHLHCGSFLFLVLLLSRPVHGTRLYLNMIVFQFCRPVSEYCRYMCTIMFLFFSFALHETRSLACVTRPRGGCDRVHSAWDKSVPSHLYTGSTLFILPSRHRECLVHPTLSSQGVPCSSYPLVTGSTLFILPSRHRECLVHPTLSSQGVPCSSYPLVTGSTLFILPSRHRIPLYSPGTCDVIYICTSVYSS